MMVVAISLAGYLSKRSRIVFALGVSRHSRTLIMFVSSTTIFRLLSPSGRLRPGRISVFSAQLHGLQIGRVARKGSGDLSPPWNVLVGLDHFPEFADLRFQRGNPLFQIVRGHGILLHI